ncbi:hypothetical protein NEFER03_2177 [Nematocida sp. LUAm3]|nr:hypothetical protein NEFER03_2177 [Nematocida sp. LUAm3]KAI5176285.1 hypothetical protein NEFER02_2077 [Nematocida sp. LUAm2]KAI5179243.1 hypothetical protein NEFER01_2097 [Nematocida sp. LUAm1]
MKNTSIYTVKSFLHFLGLLIEQVKDEKYPKYRKKLCNCYINNTIKTIQNEDISMSKRFLLLVCMFVFIEHLGDLLDEADKKDLEKVKKESMIYLCKKEITRIRAVILDLTQGTYTEYTEYLYRPEKWPLRIIEELEDILPSSEYLPEKSQAKVPLTLLVSLIAKEIKEIFLSKSQKFTKRGNLLIINLLQIETYLKKREEDPILISPLEDLIKKIRENFLEEQMIDNLDKLRKCVN